VLLDGAAFLPTNQLDLSRWHPDFLTLSFYKIFGYPTGLGALVARRMTLHKLRRPWFAGGTITSASVQGDAHKLVEGEAGFEDGTMNYLNIPAVASGLRHLDAIGIDTIHTRVQCLTGWLLDSLRTLRHRNGASLITIYGPVDTKMRGGTLAINFFDSTGQLIDYRLIEQHANAIQISLRTGCFCNPGASEVAHGLTSGGFKAHAGSSGRATFEQFRHAVNGKALGAVRVSLGLASNFADVATFAQFARGYLDWPAGDCGTISPQAGFAET
jgi:molybdenum cofactor sulfurtransferase